MPLIEQLYSLIILSLAVAAVAWTVTQEEIFSEPRDYCKRRSTEAPSLLQRKFFYLFTCEYCFSFWAGLFFIILTHFRLLIHDWCGYLLAPFVISSLSNPWMS